MWTRVPWRCEIYSRQINPPDHGAPLKMIFSSFWLLAIGLDKDVSMNNIYWMFYQNFLPATQITYNPIKKNIYNPINNSTQIALLLSSG